MSVQTYSPADVALSFSGNLIGGYADGSFIKVEREADAFTKVVGADGEVTRTKSANRSGSITITLKQTSNSNSILGGIAASDEINDDGVGEVALRDNLGNEIFAGNGWIKKLPASEFGKDLSNREWVIDCDKLDFTFAEVAANV